jgi:Fe2+ transport system protein FeoA
VSTLLRDLSTIEPGTTVEIESVPDGKTRARLLRLGFLDGPIECRRRVPNGPVVMHRNGTDLAIGKPVAEDIAVRDAES